MTSKWTYAGLAVVALGVGMLTAADPTTQPTSQPGIAATVGTARITTEQLDRLAAKQEFPPEATAQARRQVRQMLLGGLIHAELLHAYLEANQVACTDADIDKTRKEIEKEAAKQKMTFEQWMASSGMTMPRLTDLVRAQKVVEGLTSADKLDAFVKAHPAYFNGTKVRASHILITCNPLAPTVNQKAAIQKLQELTEEISAGRLTFAMAANLHSGCPSKQKGGDLGEFTFDSMAPPFAQAAFDTPVGQTAGIVRTRFGFHLIKVTGKTDGKDAPKAEAARDVAKAVIRTALQNSILDQALTTCPIVIHEKK